MEPERPYSKREMDIVLENLTKDFTLAIHKLDNHILALDGKIEAIELKLDSKIVKLEEHLMVSGACKSGIKLF